MIGSLLSEIVLREVPTELLAGVKAGDLKVYGSIVRSLLNGQIVGHLQETTDLAKMAGMALSSPASLPLQGANLALDATGHVANFVQNEQIKAAVAVVQNLQVASLGLGVVGVGVSVAGFAILSRKIGMIEAKVDALGGRLDVIARHVETMNRDVLADLFTRLRTAAAQMDEGWSLADPSSQWRQVATDTHTLANLFYRRAGDMLAREDADPDVVEPLLEALALASSTRVSARLAAGDDAVARRAAEEATSVLADLGERLATGRMLHNQLQMRAIEPGTPEWGNELDAAAGHVRTFARSVRAREVSAVSTLGTLDELALRDVSGRAWLEAARAEEDSPVLFLPALKASSTTGRGATESTL